mgnify:CR=1 FL=1
MTAFLPEELAEVSRIAAMHVGAGIWKKMERITGAGFDRIIIWFSDREGIHYRLERDQSGWTYLLLCGADDWRLLVSGPFDECLQWLRKS